MIVSPESSDERIRKHDVWPGMKRKKPRGKRGLFHVSVERCQAENPFMANSPTPARSVMRSTSPTGPRNGMATWGTITDIE